MAAAGRLNGSSPRHHHSDELASGPFSWLYRGELQRHAGWLSPRGTGPAGGLPSGGLAKKHRPRCSVLREYGLSSGRSDHNTIPRTGRYLQSIFSPRSIANHPQIQHSSNTDASPPPKARCEPQLFRHFARDPTKCRFLHKLRPVFTAIATPRQKRVAKNMSILLLTRSRIGRYFEK